MPPHILVHLAAIAGLSVLHCPAVAAGDRSPTDIDRSEDVPLTQDDLRDITAQVMAEQPLLSSSPGIKYANAYRIWGKENAIVIFQPHSEEAGIKQAFQVECTRQPLTITWNCEGASIRRYLSFATQDYEVRVTGPIGLSGAIALIEASRQVVSVVADEGVAVPDTVSYITSYDDGASVTWVNFERNSAILIEGQIAEGGDPAQPGDWIVSRFDPDRSGAE